MKKQEIKSSLIPILRKYNIKKAALFGSFVRSEETENSDLDILVEFEKGRSLFDLVRLKRDLEEITMIKTDVITYKSLHPLLKQNILAEQEVFYEEGTEKVS